MFNIIVCFTFLFVFLNKINSSLVMNEHSHDLIRLKDEGSELYSSSEEKQKNVTFSDDLKYDQPSSSYETCFINNAYSDVISEKNKNQETTYMKENPNINVKNEINDKNLELQNGDKIKLNKEMFEDEHISESRLKKSTYVVDCLKKESNCDKITSQILLNDEFEKKYLNSNLENDNAKKNQYIIKLKKQLSFNDFDNNKKYSRAEISNLQGPNVSVAKMITFFDNKN